MLLLMQCITSTYPVLLLSPQSSELCHQIWLQYQVPEAWLPQSANICIWEFCIQSQDIQQILGRQLCLFQLSRRASWSWYNFLTGSFISFLPCIGCLAPLPIQLWLKRQNTWSRWAVALHLLLTTQDQDQFLLQVIELIEHADNGFSLFCWIGF